MTEARFGSIGMLVVGVAIVLLGGVGVAVVLTSRDASEVEGAPDPVLVDVLAAIGDAQSYRFMSVGEEASFPDIDEAATGAVSRSAGSGEWTPDRWRMLVEKDNSAVETVLEGNTAYTRVGDDVAALRAERWTKHENAIVPLEELLGPDDLNQALLQVFGEDEEVRDMIVLSLAGTVYLHADEGSIQTDSIWTTDPTIGDPTGYLDAISHMTETRVVERADGVTKLEGVLPPPSGLVQESGEVFPAGQMELTVEPDGLPSTLRFTVALGANSSSIEIHFTDWNEPVEIDVPLGESIDAHPRVDEEGLRSARVPLVWPTDLPADWELTIYSPDAVIDLGLVDTTCDAVGLSWSKPFTLGPDAEQDSDYFSISLRALDCALAEDPTPFLSGGPAGLPSRTRTDDPFIEVQVGETAVIINTSLTGPDLDAVVATLTPVDVDTLLAASP